MVYAADIPGSICEYIKRFFLRAKQAPLNSYKNNRIITPFCSKPQSAAQQAPERSGIIAPIYKLLYIRDKSIALLCKFAVKKLQISFVYFAQNPQLTGWLNVPKSLLTN